MVKSGEVTRILILKSATENHPKLIRNVFLILISHTYNFSSAAFPRDIPLNTLRVSFPPLPLHVKTKLSFCHYSNKQTKCSNHEVPHLIISVFFVRTIKSKYLRRQNVYYIAANAKSRPLVILTAAFLHDLLKSLKLDFRL
jgi:hypothetical protein